MVKYNSNGDTLWSRRFSFIGNLSNDLATINAYSGGYLVGGNCRDTVHGTYVGCITKFDKDGNRFFAKVFSSIKNEVFKASAIIKSNRYVFSFYHRGETMYDSTYNRLLITDSLGNIIYQKYIFSEESQTINSIQPDINGDIMFVGESYLNVSQSLRDIYVLRTDSMLNFPPYFIGIKKIDNVVPSGFKLYQNFPNPFNPITNIKFSIPRASFVQIKVYDIIGREVAVLVNGQLKPGTYEVEWDGYNSPSGVYFYKIESGSYTETKKMVLIK